MFSVEVELPKGKKCIGCAFLRYNSVEYRVSNDFCELLHERLIGTDTIHQSKSRNCPSLKDK